MKAFYCDHFVLPLPDGHRFPMAKYAMLRKEVLAEGLVDASDLHVPRGAANGDLAHVHLDAYVEDIVRGALSSRDQRRIGFPWSPQLVERSRRSAGGTIAASRAALRDGAAVNLAGGTHHAFPGSGEGFCVFNDCAVAARLLQRAGLAHSILIVDCDVHQGNGTAAVFSHDPSVFTFSMHGANNYPFRKRCSDLDVAMDDGTEDEEYLGLLGRHLEDVLARRAFDIAFYVAGADPFDGDRLGRLALTKRGLAERDRMVFQALSTRRIPVAVVMAGGYAERVEDTVDIHVGTVRAAARIARRAS